MSAESIPASSQQDIFKDFDSVHIDPFILHVFDKMKHYEELLKDQLVDSATITEIMNELDGEWRILMREEATITGVLSFLPVDKDAEDASETVEFCTDETITFGGVLPVQIDTETSHFQDTDVASEEQMHRYELRVGVYREVIDSSAEVTYQTGNAKVDDVLSIEFHDMMSEERAQNWLAYYHARDIEDIEVDLLAPSESECEMILRLAEHVVDVGMPHKDDTTMTRRSMQALKHYTNSLLKFDKEAPYIMKVEGTGYELVPEGALEITYFTGRTMVSLERVEWLEPDQENKEDKSANLVAPYVVARFLNETKDEPSGIYMVAVSSIVSLESVRRSFFDD